MLLAIVLRSPQAPPAWISMDPTSAPQKRGRPRKGEEKGVDVDEWFHL